MPWARASSAAGLSLQRRADDVRLRILGGQTGQDRVVRGDGVDFALLQHHHAVGEALRADRNGVRRGARDRGQRGGADRERAGCSR
jgi:hypothetical protein